MTPRYTTTTATSRDTPTRQTAGLTTEYDYDDAGRVARSVVRKENDSAYNGSRVQYAYSKSGKISNLSYDTGDGEIKSYVYTYANDNLPVKSVFPDGSTQTLNYDSLRRNSERIYYPVKNAVAAKRLYTTAAFVAGQSSATSHKGSTALIGTYKNQFGTGTTNKTSEFTYTYDEWGNITGITESVRGNKGTYTYNDYGELTKAVEKYASGTWTYDYTYDSGENIQTEKITGPSGTKTHTYGYDSVWKDKLVSYDGKAITYDAMGNPTNYMGATMEWDVKGNLVSVSGRNGKSAKYTYLSDGQRYTKTTGGKTTTYLYNNGLLLSETTGNEVINYYYDSDGTILGIGYKKGSNAEKHYFFEKNAFGDVIAVYRNSDSVLIGTYEYDLWGNPVSVKEAASGRDTDGILQKNPFRYRCYYYDTETGFYYLNSRYYDPQTRRFISADDRIAEIGASAIGYNLYAYCDNSPLGAADYDGHFAITLAVGVTISVGFILEVAAVGSLAYMVYDYSQNPYNEQNPVAVLGNMLSDQMGTIRNAKNKKKGEKAGKGKAGTGEVDKGISKPNKQTSKNQMQKQVERGQAPKEIKRVDSAHTPDGQPHIHFVNNDSALNLDGTWKDAGEVLPVITNKIAEWILKNGWNLPKE